MREYSDRQECVRECSDEQECVREYSDVPECVRSILMDRNVLGSSPTDRKAAWCV